MSRHLVAVVLLVAAPLAWAQIYKWVDEKGRVQYGEKPPAGAKATPLKPPAPGAAAKPGAADDLATQEAEFRRRQLQQREEQERQAAAAKIRKARCDYARDDLVRAQQSTLYRVEGGQRVYLSDAERQATLAGIQARISENCR